MSYIPVQLNSPAGLWQQSGIGDYEDVGDWTWMFDPGAYWWLAPQDSTVQPPIPSTGLGDCGCGGKCGGCGHNHGVSGFGLFDSMDFTTWGWQEWGVVGLIAWGAVGILSDVKRARRKVRRASRRRATA